MKQAKKIAAALLLVILIGIPSTAAIFYYTKPMDDASYNLSILADDGQEWEGPKGWTVYTNEAGEVKELISDGSGGYLGLDKPGQTFYYSRRLTEKLDSPTLQIGAVNRSISVFLDDTMLYTDCPEQERGIGFLNLPMLEYDRTDPVTVSLPPNYLGHTLTIAQSSPIFSEKQSDNETVFPCDITLYCGYAYESGIIASAAQTMLPAAFLFAAEFFILAIFLLNVFKGTFLLKLPVFALAVLLQICSILSKADFFPRYFANTAAFDVSALLFFLSIGTLMLFLALYVQKLRFLFLIFFAVQWGCALFSVMVQNGLLSYGELYLFIVNLPDFTGFIILLLTAVIAFILYKQGSSFFCTWTKAFLLFTAGYVLFLCLTPWFLPGYAGQLLSIFASEIAGFRPNILLKLIWALCFISTLAAVLADMLTKELLWHTEKAVLAEKNRLAVESYENLRRQSEETHLLIHDTAKHYTLLRTMLDQAPERMAAYLDELIGQTKQIRPVVVCQNQILNILINGKLNQAAQKGIAVEIIRSDAPKRLPLTDAQLCGLFTNILDNAIEASSLAADGPWLRLDFHCKNSLFVFSCENSSGTQPKRPKAKPFPSHSFHGYGMKIIAQIMEPFGKNMISVEQTEKSYKIVILIPIEKEVHQSPLEG